MYNYNYKFPYIVQGDGIVVGEVVRVSDEELKQLDRYEGLDRKLYKRERETVFSVNNEDDEGVECWVYVGDGIVPKVESGDWNDV